MSDDRGEVDRLVDEVFVGAFATEVENVHSDALLLAALGLDLLARYGRLSKTLHETVGGTATNERWDVAAAVGRRIGLESGLDALLGVAAASLSAYGAGGAEHFTSATLLADAFTEVYGDVASWTDRAMRSR